MSVPPVRREMSYLEVPFRTRKWEKIQLPFSCFEPH